MVWAFHCKWCNKRVFKCSACAIESCNGQRECFSDGPCDAEINCDHDFISRVKLVEQDEEWGTHDATTMNAGEGLQEAVEGKCSDMQG